MRESNFRSAIANRASVSITTTLYDRRALDCTSDRPLINSLNHLAYLTSSSARVRETLCMDGGLERLVAILKECQASGPTCDQVLITWKWSLALQCLLFLGTRGSEHIRRRVVEAGAIPVIATVLDNYLELLNENNDDSCFSSDDSRCCERANRSRTVVLPLDHTRAYMDTRDDVSNAEATDVSEMTDSMVIDSALIREQSQQGIVTVTQESQDNDNAAAAGGEQLISADQPWRSLVTTESVSHTTDGPSVTDISTNYTERILQMFGIGPTTAASAAVASPIPRSLAEGPSATPRRFHGRVLIPRDEDVVWSLEILAFVSKYAYLKTKFQTSHLVPRLSVRDPSKPPLLAHGQSHDDDMHMEVENGHDDHVGHQHRPDEPTCGGICYDNYDFEAYTHMDAEYSGDSLNVFPLVEQFTARKFPREVPYWAGIIMRNSCRKDESRGGIRQCANFQCGKWESFPRHFAKCRQCKRTKYCSKACQLAAWPFHRYWCAPSTSSNPSTHSTASGAPAERPQSVGQGTASRRGGPVAGAAPVAAAATASPEASTEHTVQALPGSDIVPPRGDPSMVATTL